MSAQDHLGHRNLRLRLDQIFFADSVLSITFGALALSAPHVFVAKITGGTYNHEVHETVRYECFFTCYFDQADRICG